MTATSPSIPDAPPPTDAQRLQTVVVALRKVAPPQLPVDAVRLRLYDGQNAGARRFANYYELAVARSFVDQTSDRPEFETTIAHEVGHLLDPRLNLKLLTLAPMFAAAGVFLLSLLGVLNLPVDVATEGCALLAIILATAMTALLRAAEYRADLTAARLTSPDAVHKMLGLFARAGVRQPTGWRKLLNTHPSPEQRQARLLAAVDRPPSAGGGARAQ